MPTILKDKFQPGFDGIPPGMSKEDLLLWKRYRTEAYKDAVNVYFNVGVGGQTEAPEGTNEEIAKAWLLLTQKRIDVVIETNDAWKIIEIRSIAESGAIGRLFAYRELWNQDPPDKKPTRLILVTDRDDRDLAITTKGAGIEYIIT